MRDIGADPGGFDYWWSLLQFAFDVTEPTAFPVLAHGLKDDELRVIGRFAETAVVMARSGHLNAPEHINVSFSRESLEDEFAASVETSFAPPDLTAGLGAYFRQCYSPRERASAHRVTAILMRVARSNAEAMAELQRWRKMMHQLRHEPLKKLLLQRLHEEGLWGPLDESDHEAFAQEIPEKLISEYLYGDHIHWDRHAKTVEQRRQSEFLDAWLRMAFREAITALAHSYIGFAVLARVAVGNTE